jgi:zinc metalloprotease ZmpB
MKKLLFFGMLLQLSYVPSLRAQSADNKKAGLDWIESQRGKLEMNPAHEFKFTSQREGSAGQTIRYQQTVGGVPVYGCEMVVNFSEENEVVYSSNSYDKSVAIIDVVPSITDADAIRITNKSLSFSEINSQKSTLYVYNKLKGGTKLVYRVVTQAFDKAGLWEVIVDAKTAEVLSTKDISIKHHSNTNKKKEKRSKAPQSMAPLAFVKGAGMVFTPDPLSKAHVAYGGQYVDGNDATTASLNAARTSVELPEIDLTAGVYKLKSSYVEIKDTENPKKGLFTQATKDFNFTRDQDAFEAVNVFYHTDYSLRYINETLKIKCKPLTNNGILWFDPSGVDGEDNSHYGDGTLAFGEGGVDDAEDADVIWHELGHGIHDWLTNGNLSQVDGLSEGSGDYWAQSYSRSLKQWTANEPAYQYMFSWDAHSVDTWPGRTTAYDKKYPTGLVNVIHTDGQIWSTTLMKIWDVLGREKIDKAFLEGLALTNGNSSQQDAAIAVRQAAINMKYSCADIKVITDKFTAVGYVLPAIPLSVSCPANQIANTTTTTYTIPSYATLTNAISGNCDAVVTQTPAVGSTVNVGDTTITITAKSGATTKTCTFTLKVQRALGIEEVIKTNLKVFPNPSATEITISGDFIADRVISISSILGQKVMEHTLKSNENTINISNLDKGVYFIRFNDTNAVTKFVKN